MGMIYLEVKYLVFENFAGADRAETLQIIRFVIQYTQGNFQSVYSSLSRIGGVRLLLNSTVFVPSLLHKYGETFCSPGIILCNLERNKLRNYLNRLHYSNMPRCTNCKKSLSESDFKKFNDTLSKTCIQCLDKRKNRHIVYKNSKNQL